MKNPNGEKIIGSFYRKELLLLSTPLILRDKVKILLNLSDYVSKKIIK